MRWSKGGLIYSPAGDEWWSRTHAMLPTPLDLGDGRIRVYFTTLDDERVGRAAWVDVSAEDPSRVLGHCDGPVLDVGERGAFDDNGVNPSCVVDVDGRRRLYYIGWQLGTRVPHLLFAGLAEGDGDGAFARRSRAPVLDRTDAEPFSRSAPCVRRDGDGFRAWYWSCERWTSDERGTRYFNVIKHARSPDGVRWDDEGETCLSPPESSDYSVGRPWVIERGGRWRMWYSIRSLDEARPYRIAYAESADGVRWDPTPEEGGVEASPEGWDAEMVCYPAVVEVAGRLVMFYNGNRHGLTGFGYAVGRD